MEDQRETRETLGNGGGIVFGVRVVRTWRLVAVRVDERVIGRTG